METTKFTITYPDLISQNYFSNLAYQINHLANEIAHNDYMRKQIALFNNMIYNISETKTKFKERIFLFQNDYKILELLNKYKMGNLKGLN